MALRLIPVICLLLLFSACASDKPITVIDRSVGAGAIGTGNQQGRSTRIVGSGDTLYAIAFVAGVDFRDLAHWNDIEAPYTIFVGQTLRMKGPPRTHINARQNAAKQAPKTSKTSSAKTNKKVVASSNKPKAVKRVANSSVDGRKKPARWRWPTKGKLLTRYKPSKGINGIQIAAKTGNPVIATAAGEVVYVGSGLRGYGNLVIVKHNRQYLSAYAHNDSILVKEGALVKSGQQIARVGSSDADRSLLHFEIRRDGKPIDPLKFLK